MNLPTSLTNKLGTPAYVSGEFVGWTHCYEGWTSLVWRIGSRYARCQNCGMRFNVEGSFKKAPSILDKQIEAWRVKPDWRSVSDSHWPSGAYLRGRGLVTAEMDEHFCTDSENPGYVIAPIEQDGVVVQWHGRRIRPGKPKYISGQSKDGWMYQGECVWGLDRVIADQPVYVCEGIFDALYFPTGVAIMGGEIQPAKAVKILDRCPSRVVLCLDKVVQPFPIGHELAGAEEMFKDPDKEWAWIQAFQIHDIHMEVQILYPPEGSKDFGEQLTKRRYGDETG